MIRLHLHLYILENLKLKENMKKRWELKRMHNLIVEDMTEKHLDDVLKINNSSFTSPLSLDSLKSEFNDNAYKYIVLKDIDKNIILGYASLWFMLEDRKSVV